MAARLAKMLAIVLIAVSVLSPFLEFLLVGAILSGRGNEGWTGRYLGGVVAFRLFEACISCSIAGGFLFISSCIRRGGIVSVWFAAVLSVLLALFHAVVVMVSLVLVLCGELPAFSQVYSSPILLGLYAPIAYFSIRTLLLRANVPLKYSRVQEDKTYSLSLSDVVEFFRSRVAAFACSIILLLANVVYLGVAATNFSAFWPVPVQIPSAPAPPVLPALPQKLAIITIREPYADDVFDPVEGMNRADRQKFIEAIKAKSKVSDESVQKIDGLLRHAGHRLVPDVPSAAAALRVSPHLGDWFEIQFPQGSLCVGLDQSHVSSARGRNFHGTLDVDGLVWEAPERRWSCLPIEKHMGKIKAELPAATPLQLAAICELIRTFDFTEFMPGEVDASVKSSAANCVILTIPERRSPARYRITSQGAVFDESSEAVAKFEESLASVRNQIDVAQQTYDAQLAARTAAQESAVAQEHAVGTLRPIPHALLLDGVLGVFLAALVLRRAVVWNRDPARARLLGAMALISGGLALAIAIYILCCQDALLHVPIGFIQPTFPALLVLLAWRICQSWAAFGLSGNLAGRSVR